MEGFYNPLMIVCLLCVVPIASGWKGQLVLFNICMSHIDAFMPMWDFWLDVSNRILAFLPAESSECKANVFWFRL